MRVVSNLLWFSGSVAAGVWVAQTYPRAGVRNASGTTRPALFIIPAPGALKRSMGEARPPMAARVEQQVLFLPSAALAHIQRRLEKTSKASFPAPSFATPAVPDVRGAVERVWEQLRDFERSERRK